MQSLKKDVRRREPGRREGDKKRNDCERKGAKGLSMATGGH